MRAAAACVLLAAAALAAILAGNPSRGTPLWPRARYTREERDHAVLRGLLFITNFARQPDHFRDWGFDILSAFYNIAETSRNPELRRLAWEAGHERALAWRRANTTLPPNPGPGEILLIVAGHDAATRLGVPDPQLDALLRRAAARWTARDYLGFDPVTEPSPTWFTPATTTASPGCRAAVSRRNTRISARTCATPSRRRIRKPWASTSIPCAPSASIFTTTSSGPASTTCSPYRIATAVRRYEGPRSVHGRLSPDLDRRGWPARLPLGTRTPLPRRTGELSFRLSRRLTAFAEPGGTYVLPPPAPPP
jgi:hypothetical protein